MAALGASRGVAEGEALLKNVQDQLNRLLGQLHDCEEMREELDDEEYEEMRAETMEQIRDFEASLDSLKSGNTTLVDQLNAAQLAIEAAIKDNGGGGEAIKMFKNAEPEALRSKLSKLQEDLKLKRIEKDAFDSQALELLSGLKNLGEMLTADELSISQAVGGGVSGFTKTSDTHVGAAAEGGLLAAAASDLSAAK